MKFPAFTSAAGMGATSTVVATLSTFFIFATGLISVIQAVPGCSEALIAFFVQNAAQLSLLIGVPIGIVTYIIGLLHPNTKNY